MMIMARRDGPYDRFPSLERMESNAALEQLKKDNEALKKAGSELAVAAFRVVFELDGLHRLMLATAAWAKRLQMKVEEKHSTQKPIQRTSSHERRVACRHKD